MQEEEECFIPTPENTNTYAQTVRVEKPNILSIAKKKVANIFKMKSQFEANKLGFQGQLLHLLAEEEEDIAWKGCIYQVPRGVMAWAFRASTNLLATPHSEICGMPLVKVPHRCHQ